MLDTVHWKNSVRDWLGALGKLAPKTVSEGSIADIRDAMLDAVARAESGGRAALKTRLSHRILMASDIEALWFLRSDVMQLLCVSDGEEQARRELDAVSARFNGLLPAGLGPRQHGR